ncbi:MAG TPA: hypothetical protein VER58_01095 [Thermoanaerobaculia bacterium]|nr:hypothetical protein [Thermoanaerobaculia bacterium]
MTSSIIAPLTSTSPRFEVERRLTGSVVTHTTEEERGQMYALFETYFLGTDRARFESDLAEKDGVILLRDGDRIRGFSTFLWIREKEFVAFFSGDTIVDRDYWGETVLSRMWAQIAFAEADRIDSRVYWFLISSGYKTWRFLPVFFREFYPNPELTMPPHIRNIIDHLGVCKFGDQYADGIVRFRNATPLRRGVAEITDERLRDPNIAFFARANPGHANGDELACLTEVSRSNLTRAGQRMVR